MKKYINFNLILLSALSVFFWNASILLFGGIMLGIICTLLRNEKSNIFYINLTIVTMICMFIMLLIYFGFDILYEKPYYMGGSDDLKFESYALSLVEKDCFTISQARYFYKGYTALGFIWILSWIMRICTLFGGYHTIVYRAISIYQLIIIAILMYKFVKKRYRLTESQNYVLLYFGAVFMNSVYLSSFVFRDTLNSLLLFSIFYAMDYILKDHPEKKKCKITIFGILMCLLGSYIIRQQSFLFGICIIVICIFVNFMKKEYFHGIRKQYATMNKRVKLLMYIILALLMISIPFILNMFLRYVNNYTALLVSSQSGFSKYVFMQPLIPFGIPLRFAYGLVSPFPNSILEIFHIFDNVEIFLDVVISIGTLIQLFLLPYLFKNMRRLKSEFFVFIMLYLSIIMTTFTFRHFILIYPFLFICILPEFFLTSKTLKIKTFKYMSLFIAASAILYFILKIII